MVSMDGEAHPNMTLAAIGLGVFVALIILLTLIAFITRRERSSHTKVAHQHSGPVHPPHTPAVRPPSIIPTISQKVTDAAPRCTVSFVNELELTDVVTRM
ncbi:AGAP000299-PA-like protein [Anopheles sinensis]|uniref:AGAP000299-PA-like protein n=1 Tax=Anopheles sinensis TaxID=74873 RepID=A0A084WPF5_ANOSI|nr:AGAP000299-PA-like protein [Anopheles sinensis]